MLRQSVATCADKTISCGFETLIIELLFGSSLNSAAVSIRMAGDNNTTLLRLHKMMTVWHDDTENADQLTSQNVKHEWDLASLNMTTSKSSGTRTQSYLVSVVRKW